MAHRLFPAPRLYRASHGDQRTSAAPAGRARRRRLRPARRAHRRWPTPSCPQWRWLLRWPLVALALVAAVTAVVATIARARTSSRRGPSCEPLGRRPTRSWGELLRTGSLAFVVVAALGAWALGGPSALASGRGARESQGRRRLVATVLLVVGAVGAAGAGVPRPATPAPGPSGADGASVSRRALAGGEQPPERLDPVGVGLARRSTASSRPHSGSSSPWVQPRGQSSVISSRSGNAPIRSSGCTCASPKERMPGVSMIQPSPSGQLAACSADVEVCRPRPVTALTMPTSRSASGTSALTSVDLPTPL